MDGRVVGGPSAYCENSDLSTAAGLRHSVLRDCLQPLSGNRTAGPSRDIQKARSELPRACDTLYPMGQIVRITPIAGYSPAFESPAKS